MKRLDRLIELLSAIYYLLNYYIETHSEPFQQAAELEDWLDKEGVKRYLKITNSTYYRWVQSGKLKPRGNIGAHRYYKSDLVALLAQRKLRYRG